MNPSPDIPLLFGPYGSVALAYADTLASYDVNACWFHMFDAGAFEVCARHGLAACVEFRTFRADFNRHPELIPIGVDGKPIRYGRLVQGVCLSQQEFLERIETDLHAGVRTYQPAGIWLDYLTYAGWFEVPDPDLQESCFCDACIARFCEQTGVDAHTPAEILARHADAWTLHKCARVEHFARRYAQIIRTEVPGLCDRRVYVPVDSRGVRQRADAYLRAGLCIARCGDRHIYPFDLWHEERPIHHMGPQLSRARTGVCSTGSQTAAHPRCSGWAGQPNRDGRGGAAKLGASGLRRRERVCRSESCPHVPGCRLTCPPRRRRMTTAEALPQQTSPTRRTDGARYDSPQFLQSRKKCLRCKSGNECVGSIHGG
jgi:hypothetical protein